MRVKMRSLCAGPSGVLRSGEVHDLPEAQAREFIAGGFAEPVDAPPAPQKETAAGRGAREKAARTERPKGRETSPPNPAAPKGDPPDVHH